MEKISRFIKILGPGILLAGAAIGGSHLVQSTRAGADYGFQLIWLVALCCLLKYPFFQYSQRYTAATGETILHGYNRLGRWQIITFAILSFLVSVVNISAVTFVTAALATAIFKINLSVNIIAVILQLFCVGIMWLGKYKWLDRLMKIKVTILSICTIIALLAALHNGPVRAPEFQAPSPWTMLALPFLIALMGWMPAPIEVSVWPSLWAVERRRNTKKQETVKEALLDFNTGYIASFVLAVVFLGLGAMVLYGSGNQFPESGLAFAKMFLTLYTSTLGRVIGAILGFSAFVTMFSTMMACADGYPRSMAHSITLIKGETDTEHENSEKLYWFFLLFEVLIAIFIIAKFTKNLRALLDFATILSFLFAPVFAYINYRVVTSDHMPEEHRPGRLLRGLSWCGIIFFSVFSIYFIYHKFLA